MIKEEVMRLLESGKYDFVYWKDEPEQPRERQLSQPEMKKVVALMDENNRLKQRLIELEEAKLLERRRPIMIGDDR